MKILSININDYHDDFSQTNYEVTLETDTGNYDGILWTNYNDCTIKELLESICDICKCNTLDIENDIWQLRDMFKTEIILRR